MRMTRKFILFFFLIFSFKVWAASFVVRAIKIEGLELVTRDTVLNYIAIKPGETLDESKTTEIIHNLYQTGFFTNVKLAREGNTLIIKVIERATIGSIVITGNKAIKTDDIKKMLKDAGIKVGEVADRAALDSIRQALLAQYRDMAYYNATVDVSTIQQSRNRTTVKVTISEGKMAKIRDIHIIGNRAFSERKLLRQFTISKTHLWSFITKTDRYSKDKLNASLDALKAFYMDHGYLRFKVDSYHVNYTPDRTGIFITVNITEGPRYRFSGYRLAGDLILPEEQMRRLVKVRAGDIFSRKAVTDTTEAIGVALGDKGYSFARIEPVPTVDEQNKTVLVTFYIYPGQQVYVRRVIFEGNTLTADYVLRHAVQQMEGGLINVTKIRESVRQLNLLGYFKDVQVKTVPVTGTNNQVDLIYSVKEAQSGSASLTLGYGTLGFELGAGVNQPNFMGTGRTVGLNASWTRYLASVGFNYYNPFFTTSGIGHGLNLYFQHAKPEDLNLAEYSYDLYGGTSYYTIPIALNDTLHAGYGFNHYSLDTQPVPSKEIASFVDKNGHEFNQVLLTAGWKHVGQDQAIFPTEGLNNSLNFEFSAPAFGEPLEYYKVDDEARYFQPLTRSKSFILELVGGVGYGNTYNGEVLPFFVNYFAGGLSQGLVRGYETNTLGPRDSFGQPLGGNLLLHATSALIFPNYISESLRTSVFVDMGNVYQTKTDAVTFGPGPFRYSAGLGIEWRSPVGPLSFSLAKPINRQPGDRQQIFQFTIGTTF